MTWLRLPVEEPWQMLVDGIRAAPSSFRKLTWSSETDLTGTWGILAETLDPEKWLQSVSVLSGIVEDTVHGLVKKCHMGLYTGLFSNKALFLIGPSKQSCAADPRFGTESS